MVTSGPSAIESIYSELKLNLAVHRMPKKTRIMRQTSPTVVVPETTHHGVHTNKQKLSQNEELETIKYCELWMLCGLPVWGKVFVSKMSNAVHAKSLTENWARDFLRRYASFEKKFSRARNLKINDEEDLPSKQKRLCGFLDAFHELKRDKNVLDEHVYVMSDTAYALAIEGENKHTTIGRLHKSRMHHETRDLASVIFCAPYGGRPISAQVTFKRMQEPRKREFWEAVRVGDTETGWAGSSQLLDWIQHVFNPRTNPTRAKGMDEPPRLLLFDNERFKISEDFFMMCVSMNIFCLSLPKNSGTVFKSLECTVSSFVDSQYEGHMRQNFRRAGRKFRIDDRSFAGFIGKQLKDPRCVAQAKQIWRETGLMPMDRACLRDRIRNHQATPAPENNQAAPAARSKSRTRAPAVEVTLPTPPLSSQQSPWSRGRRRARSHGEASRASEDACSGASNGEEPDTPDRDGPEALRNEAAEASGSEGWAAVDGSSSDSADPLSEESSDEEIELPITEKQFLKRVHALAEAPDDDVERCQKRLMAFLPAIEKMSNALNVLMQLKQQDQPQPRAETGRRKRPRMSR